MKTMALLASTITLLLTYEAPSQWLTTSGPEGGRADHFCTTATSALLALEGGAIYRSTDKGIHWTCTVEALSPVADEYGGLVAAGGALFAATMTSGVYRSTDDGLSWTPASGALPSQGRGVLAITTVNDTVLIATYAGIYRTGDGGMSWVSSNAGLPTDTVFNAFAVAGTTVLVGSDEGAGVFRSTDAGWTWTRSGTGLSGQGLNVLCFAETGGTIVAGTRQGAYRSTDDGVQWALCSSGLTTRTVSVLLAHGDTLFAGTYGGGVYRSTNNGVDWSATPTGPSNGNIRALTAVGSDLLAGTYGPDVVYKSTDNGDTWSATGQGITCNGIRSLALHGGLLFAASYSTLFSTSDRGVEWKTADSLLTSKTIYMLLSRSNDLLAGTAGGGVYRSTDGGASWFAANTGLDGDARTVWAFTEDGTDLFAATSGGVYRSTNDGAAWAQATSGIIDPPVRTIGSSHGTLFAGTFSRVYRSTNAGQSWVPATSGLPQSAFAQGFVAIDSAVYLGTYSGVYRYAESGSQWLSMSTGLPSSPDVRSITTYRRPAPLGTTLFTGLSHGGVYASADGGVSWYSIAHGLAPGINVISLGADEQYLFAGTNAHSVWKRALTEVLVSVAPPDRPTGGYALGQNYPNPFNGKTVIPFELCSPSHVILRVFDVLGAEVSTPVNEKREAGMHTVVWDAGDYASGVYMCRIQAGSFVSVRRMIITR